MSAPALPRPSPAWVLLAGFALLWVGLVPQSQGNQDEDDEDPAQRLPYTTSYGTADSNGRMIAVTGVDVTGGSILYLIDTESRHMSVYQAQGGTSSTAAVKWVGGRNIDLDLKVDGFNDKSELSFKELARRFAEDGAGATADK